MCLCGLCVGVCVCMCVCGCVFVYVACVFSWYYRARVYMKSYVSIFRRVCECRYFGNLERALVLCYGGTSFATGIMAKRWHTKIPSNRSVKRVSYSLQNQSLYVMQSNWDLCM